MRLLTASSCDAANGLCCVCSPEFKSFLEGLLHKTPSKRLGWPELANHPFVRETDAEKSVDACP